jgi:mRNA-degrading endonuclease YafQ of YafQ-DinJ toxin-antitoxin module
MLIFSNNRQAVILNNHSLSGDLSNNRSIYITGDWRLIFAEVNDGNLIRLEAIDTHSQFYFLVN